MDKEQEEMQFVGFFGIFNESYKAIFEWRKIFTKITLSLILPLSFIYLVHMEVSNLFFRKIIHNEIELDHTRSGTPKYEKLSDLISDEWAYFWLFKAAYFTLFFIFSLLSTAAVVYTIACIYTARELTFNKVISVVPKVWKRLMVTFLCIFIAMFLYHVAALAILIGCVVSIGGSNLGFAVFVVLAILYLVGFLYLTAIWHLASVVSVLEEAYGFNAMVKGKNLLKGNLWLAMVIFLTLGIAAAVIQFAFQSLVVEGSGSGMANRIAYAIICLFLHSMLSLLGLVIQTVIYFVCKSYHHENIDKSALSDHLEVYLGEYVPLTVKDVQLEQYHV
ncbi:uncharacterized protein LOC105784143 [Gossypium raimondii]|uniref:Uncharacterized protein n=1 Tax=Gossypium raimondii TaxID=29730 RepID=A0A0D2SBY4_GOSRA|nr:uncharacterized protein LOC105784143 [Gossypium raimondii]KJB80607.1 hypothetical protein B456_013G106700 [Gossypium raimondii]MBA0602572.1 hypothetical protein [Gossypium raimondii]